MTCKQLYIHTTNVSMQKQLQHCLLQTEKGQRRPTGSGTKAPPGMLADSCADLRQDLEPRLFRAPPTNWHNPTRRTQPKMVNSVELTADAYLVCLTHALSTEKEEVMGLLLGEVSKGLGTKLTMV